VAPRPLDDPLDDLDLPPRPEFRTLPLLKAFFSRPAPDCTAIESKIPARHGIATTGEVVETTAMAISQGANDAKSLFFRNTIHPLHMTYFPPCLS
jgi:hypothetical protein